MSNSLKKISILCLLNPFILGSVFSAQDGLSWEDVPPSVRDAMKERGLTLDDLRENAAQRAARPKTPGSQATESEEGEETGKTPPQAIPATPIPMPEAAKAIPLDVTILTENHDGFPEETIRFQSSLLSFSTIGIQHLVVARDQSECSARLVDLYSPANELEVFLFAPRLFLPSVNERNLMGYRMDLERRHGSSIRINPDQEMIPANTFKVDGEPWGMVTYELNSDPADPTVVREFFCKARGYTLVFRLQGNSSWVADLSPKLRRALSGFEVE